MEEGEIVSEFAAFLRRREWRVVVARANNASVFFTLLDGRRKAPDIVAYRDRTLLTAEAKPTARAILGTGLRGTSDLECMEFLATSDMAKTELLDKVRPRIGAGVDLTAVTTATAVVAGDTRTRPVSSPSAHVTWILRRASKVPTFIVQGGPHLDL